MARTEEKTPRSSNPWMAMAQDAYERSTTYFDNNYRKQFEDGLRMFQSRHTSDSKYLSSSYKGRSKLFRPKTRSMIRKAESSAALAFFSSADLVAVDPVAPNNMQQVMSSVIMKDLLQQRLTTTIPWFLTVMGGLQDAMNVGLVASLQYWDYASTKEKQTKTGSHPLLGEITYEEEVEVPTVDQPCVHLLPIENVRFDPAAKWYNVAETSPYLIIEMPMYIRDIMDRMNSDEDEYAWRKHDKETLLRCRVDNDSTLRTARNDDKEDPEQVTSGENEFDVAMVHLNFFRKDGKDWTFYSLKDKEMLSKSVEPTSKVFKHCDKPTSRPVAIGFTVVETHKAVPQSPANLGKDLQIEANVVANTRLDNVLYILNKRWVIKRGSQIDVDAIVRNVPGGVVMANDTEKDLREINWADVTGSAYAEQDRINVDYDELLGNFAQSSVMTNRKLNETVGGMRMMAQGANAITEYTLKVFVETWVEPVLRQLMKLEQYYETDEYIMAIAQERSKAFIKGGVPEVTPMLLQQELVLSVNVGMGATDPDTRFQRFMQATGAYMKIANEGPPDFNLQEVRKEIYGLAGWKDAMRFFQKPDPRFLQAKQMLGRAKDIAQQEIQKNQVQQIRRDKQLEDKAHTLDIREFETDVTNRLDELTRLVKGALGDNRAALKLLQARKKANGDDRRAA